MERDIQTMAVIQAEKQKEIEQSEPQALDAEGAKMAQDKRMTFDMPINVPLVDPLR